MTAGSERFLVTGALGCIGAWTVRALVRDGADVIAFDLGTDARRLRLIMSDEELAGVHFEVGDITDLAPVERVLDAGDITNVIHLAALQVPFCRADPRAARWSTSSARSTSSRRPGAEPSGWRRSCTRARWPSSPPTTPTR